jgi:hypothetical protein
VDVATIEADDERQVRTGQFFPVALAGAGETELFLTELALQPGCDGLGLAAHHGGVQFPSKGQQLAEQFRGDAVGDEPGGAGLPARPRIQRNQPACEAG